MAGNEVWYQPGSIEAGLANGEKLLEGNPSAALLQGETLLHVAPQDPAVHRLMAKALSRLGRPDEARQAWSLAVQNSRHVPAIVEAHKATLDGRSGEAETLLRDHLARHPDDPVALMVSGEALARTGRVNEAIARFEAALLAMPEYREARLGLARAHYQRFDPRSAMAALGPLLEANAGDTALLRWQAALLGELGRSEEAEALLGRLVDQAPRDAALLVSHGDALRGLGRTDEAEAEYRKAIASAPGHGAPWWSLASLGRIADADRSALQATQARANQPDDRMYLAFAEGTAADHAGEFERAFKLYSEANRLRRATLAYDGAAFARRMDALAALDPGFFETRAAWGAQDPSPIFIVGMPRSGSTLLEQLLARHSEVAAGGEMPIVTALLRETAARMTLDPEVGIVDLLERLTAEECAALGAEYLRRARDRVGREAPRFTDKLPHNWAEIAFIRLILPRARIVDLRRGALDCIVSNFALLFQPGHPASYDLGEMADYYATYVRSMEWTGKVMPGAVHLLCYEKLVDDTEGAMRALLGFLELPFEPACLDPVGGERAITTASAEQARRPINREGIGRWKRFEPWLGELRERLGPLAET